MNVELTHPDKVLFPQGKITKAELMDYYVHVARWLLPLVKERPISLVRYPEGIAKEGFFQKNAPASLPPFVETTSVVRKEKGKTTMLLCSNRSTLAWLANQNCITLHLWLSRIGKPDYPDRMVFDLDPPPRKSFQTVVEVAYLLKEVLEKQAKLKPFVTTTGSRGLHVVVPLKPTHPFDDVREVAKEIAAQVMEKAPRLCTLEVRKEKRKGKVYIDIQRNGYGQTVVAPYSVRALPHAPIATPLFWSELEDPKLRSNSFCLRDFAKERTKNPWAAIDRSARTLSL